MSGTLPDELLIRQLVERWTVWRVGALMPGQAQ